MKRILFLLVLILPFTARAQSLLDEEPPEDKPPSSQEVLEHNMQALAHGNDRFALDLYSQIRRAGGNMICSPYSISSALSIPYAGAGGATKTQMEAVLHLLPKDRDVNEAFSAINRVLETAWTQGSNDNRIILANALWMQRDLILAPAFAKSMDQYFPGAIKTVDFMRNPESGVSTINNWVREKTHGRIVQLLQREDVSRDTRLVVVSSILLKAVWENVFDPSLTTETPFFQTRQRTGSISMMTTTANFPFYKGHGYSVIEMPYRQNPRGGAQLVMLAILPDDIQGLDSIESLLIPEQIDSWLKAVKREKVILSFPKFKAEASFSLGTTLQNMGMSAPFSNAADFSGLTGTPDLKLGGVIHKAYINIDEKGTEAVAATAVTINTTAMQVEPPRVIRFDHPFVYMIIDRTTQSILFIGRLTTPF